MDFSLEILEDEDIVLVEWIHDDGNDGYVRKK